MGKYKSFRSGAATKNPRLSFTKLQIDVIEIAERDSFRVKKS